MRIIQILAAVMIVACPASSLAQQPQRYRATLQPTPVSNPNAVLGKGAVTAQRTGRRLTISGTYAGFGSPATRADLHMGPILGVTGPAVAALTVTKGTSGTVSGSAELTPAQVAALAANKLYIEIDSESAPDGNSRGWLFIEGGR
jgi:hypothetical protein